jgi:glyoxylase-like metal-dependent hydrolase (beta-lactamase superfamily II)
MQILKNTGGVAATNSYLIACEETKQAVLFDAPNDTTAPLLEECRRHGWNLIGLWLTHAHFDHYADHAVVTKAFPDAKVLIHRADENKLMLPIRAIFALPFDIPQRRADGYFEDGQTLRIGNLSCEVFHTPGHSPGHVMFYFAKHKMIISGDVIICGGVGRTDFPDCSAEMLNHSIRRIVGRIPHDTQLLPGHCHTSTLAEELQTNPFVQEALEHVPE